MPLKASPLHVEVAGLLDLACFLAHTAPLCGAPNDEQCSRPDSPRAIWAFSFLLILLLLFLVTTYWRGVRRDGAPENMQSIQEVMSISAPKRAGVNDYKGGSQRRHSREPMTTESGARSYTGGSA